MSNSSRTAMVDMMFVCVVSCVKFELEVRFALFYLPPKSKSARHLKGIFWSAVRWIKYLEWILVLGASVRAGNFGGFCHSVLRCK